jgi:excinuclease ABC subunit B
MYVNSANKEIFKDKENLDFIENKYLGKLFRDPKNKGKFINSDGLYISDSMLKAINLTLFRREKQIEYNKKHNITPKTIISSIKDI